MQEWHPRIYRRQKLRARKSSHIQLDPPSVLGLGFLVLILCGTLLLKLPFATQHGASWLEALFTATSAVTVTGLVVLDTGSDFTLFGQLVIALLIQAGGLGFMTFAVVAALTLGARLGIGQQMVAQEAFNETSLDKVVQTAKYVLLYSLIIETAGMLLLAFLWLDDLGPATAVYHAFFYTISGFNNAGFALSADSLMPYAGDYGINLVISSLFIIGGLGFAVLIDIIRKHAWSRFSTNTKIVLLATVVINIGAFILIWLLEMNNPATLRDLPLGQQAIAAWFQAVTPRTAGFNTLPTDQLTDATTVLTIFLMFIGGGSLSTASGIKLGTFVILILATYTFLTRRNEVTVMHRTLPQRQVMKALALAFTAMMLAILSTFVMTAIEQADFLDILFEVVSALGTVGLSRGLTTELSVTGKLLIIALMLIGRLGPLTLAYMLATPRHTRVRYAETEIQVG